MTVDGSEASFDRVLYENGWEWMRVQLSSAFHWGEALTFTAQNLSVQAVALERLEKENKDRNKKSDRKQAELAQNNHRLEARNKMLLDEVNLLVSWQDH